MTDAVSPTRSSLWSALRVAVGGWLAPYLPATALRSPSRAAGSVALVGAGPGSADLITLRGLRRLQEAQVVFYDRLAEPALLDHAPRARKVDVGKAPGRHTLPQDQINALLVAAALSGQRVVRLKCGDPGIFGRGAEEAAACRAAGILCEVIPGVTSAAAAAASAGSFLTERGQTDRVILMTGHKASADELPDWTVSAAQGTTLALYMGVAQSAAIASGLIAAGWPAASEVEIIANAQTPRETILRCPLDQMGRTCGARPGLGPAMILVRWPFEALPPVGATLARKAAASKSPAG